MDSVIQGVEILLNRAFRCIILCSGLITKRRILLCPSQDSNDNVMDTIFDVPNSLEDMLARIKSTLDTSLILRAQLDKPDQLPRRESRVKIPYEDKDLSALYEQIWKQASL
jgi:hypothetical protein